MKKRKSRSFWLVLAVVICVTVVLGVFLVFGSIPDDQLNGLDKSSVLIQFSGPYNKYSGIGVYNSLFYLYDSKGSVADSYMEGEIASSFCTVEGGDKLFLFFKNHSIVVSQKKQ